MKKWSRKKFLSRSLAAGAAVGITACTGSSDTEQTSNSAVPGKKYRWNMVTTWPPNFPILGEGCNLFAQWVKEMSAGRLNIRVYGGGELIPALESFDAVRSGTAQIGHGSSYYWAGKVPAAQFFASVPFGMNAQQLNAWIISGGGIELWREIYEPFNLIPFLGGNTNAQMGGWFNREIKSIDDFKGLKMRIPGLGGRVFEKAGGSPILTAGSEIYTSLERGVIDATEWIGPYHDYLMGFHKIAKYYYYPGWHEAGTSLEFFINKKAFEELPEDLQVIVETAAYRVNQWMMAEGEAKNSEYLSIIREEGKVDIRPFPEDVITTLRQYTNEIISKMASENEEMARIYESFQNFKKQDDPWLQMTEKVFYNNII